MKKYIIFALMLLSAGSVMAQSGMTDDQVMSFVAKEHSAGTSNSQIVTKLMQRGVDISQIRRVREKYEKMQKQGSLASATDRTGNASRLRSNNGKTRSDYGKQSDKEAANYSNYRVQAQRDYSYRHTYDSNDEEYGDMVVLDGIDKVLQVDGTFKFDMIMMVYCTKGRIQFETNSNAYTAKAGDVIICLPSSTWENVMVSPDYDSKSVGVSSKAAQASVQVNRDYLNLLGYVSHNPVIHLNEERQQMFLKYYAIIAHKIKNPHGFYHKEIMHCLLQSSIYELFAIITPYVEYSIEGGNLKQANLLFQRFIEMLSANNGRMQPVKKYAQELCITPKYLSNITKQVTGRTALDWIHSYTVKAIEKYLRRSNLSIKEISELLGFPNLSFFGKFTKSHLGMSPTQYRKEQSMRK